ncbi:L-threonylcarbamoyladenylate synthase [Granulicella sp. S190]|uniref:L-threonylcarbamoyladenylate synthase n=1 Tax=Granulicella sp. S190 TaxID=1747226 RepID=UPI00131BD9B7|nr:L-threonylcarbamoyladenylate synthase [Granulicella sp. S190]
MTQLITQRLTSSSEDIVRAASILRNGGTVAFPTETVYGLGANALETGAIERIFLAKGRPHWDPLIVHVSSRAMLDQVATVSAQAERLIDTFWPGPLTLLLPRTNNIPDTVTAGRPLVGVRMPAHPIALALIEAAGVPLAAPSANRFGHTSPTTALHVLHDLDHRIDAVIDGGSTKVGLESSVLDPNQSPAVLYRPGAITAAMIQPLTGPVVLYEPPPKSTAEPQSLPSPGVGIRHYAPRARLVLVNSEADLNSRLAGSLISDKGRIGVMLPQGWTIADSSVEIFRWSAIDDPTILAQTLFSGLRELDSRDVAIIFCPLPRPEGLGLAIRDRLKKAARSD